ncbi:EF-Hand 1, calcium-binding site domain-containing protein [Rozella allomycis CSF55]|uniref:EF-Hand 1, calcium-binding site domain-containing protein n=1 Tax=Rozella allomycis (strain CSF55) TaxID=988480 RepID=A0A075ANV8_ROZAC|nr:EF-Hand 1, calcium-binding site domain-containing protein [Rozella allomycis CSF55]|eukprot:EPZ31642.1 EF-Hand 1, calcium-binding site domain-containing protein [Rozella allomycis CSF55]
MSETTPKIQITETNLKGDFKILRSVKSNDLPSLTNENLRSPANLKAALEVNRMSVFDWNNDDDLDDHESNRDSKIKFYKVDLVFLGYKLSFYAAMVAGMSVAALPAILYVVFDISLPSSYMLVNIPPHVWSIFAAVAYSSIFLIDMFCSLIAFILGKTLSLAKREYLERILIGVMISSVMYAIEKFMIHYIAFNFHKMAYSARLLKNRYESRIVDELISRKKKGMSFRIFNQKRSEETIETADNLEQEHYPLLDWKSFKDTFKLLKVENMYKVNSKVKTLQEAKKTAKELFQFYSANSGRDYLIEDDLKICFSNKKILQEAFGVIDTDQNGELSRKEFKHFIVNVYKEKGNITKSLVDVANAMSKLDRILFGVCLVILAFIWLALYDIAIQNLLTLIASLIIATNVIVGNSAKNTFESVIFLFVSHPYDVGDTICVDKVEYVVQKINLLNTIVKRWDGVIIYLPNYILSNSQIGNFRRSAEIRQRVDLEISSSTSWEQLSQLKTNLNSFVKEYGLDFLKIDIYPIETFSLELIKFSVIVTAKPTTDPVLKCARFAKFLQRIDQILKELKINVYSTIGHPNSTVNGPAQGIY